MASPLITQYLIWQDYDRFAALVRRYSHDVLSAASNLAIGAEVAIKLLRRRSEIMLVDPAMAEDSIPPFETLFAQAIEFPNAVRQFVWGADPDDKDACTAYAQERYQPYDADVWDAFIDEYIRFVAAHLEQMNGTIEAIEIWSTSGVLTPPDQSRELLNVLASIYQTYERVWRMLDPLAAEERVKPVIQSGLGSKYDSGDS